MQRYHKKIYFPDIELLNNVNDYLNTKSWKYSGHCLENLKYRSIDLEGVLRFIRGLELNTDDIFEYYKKGDNIIKVCYRIPYNNIDLILVLNSEKIIITVYFNSSNDNHVTLKENLYCKA